MTPAERLLWSRLRDRRFRSFKFRRQVPFGPYFVDFYCAERKLVIELDGGQHSYDHAYDTRRTDHLRTLGLTVLRYWNTDVLFRTDAVLRAIHSALVRGC